MENFYFLPVSSEKVDAVQKYLLRKSNYSVDIFILNKCSAQKEAILQSNCPKELPILKK